MTEIQDVPAGSLYPHPDNPRLQLREDVIERLAVEIERGGFGREHAPLVRPCGGGFQIVSGHHRIEAATRAGLGAVPCWVKDMDDDEAFMQLVLSNTQGELSPLEIGMHALKAVPLAEGGRGKRGGIRSYAERTGLDHSRISMLRSAAQVADTVETSQQYTVADRPYHLYEISKAPECTWPILVERLTDRGWSVKDTAAQVDKIRKFDIPDRHASWLPFEQVAAAYLRNDRLNPAAVAKLVSAADGVLEYIERDGDDADAAAFRKWLEAGTGDQSWNLRNISDYHANLIRDIADRREQETELPDGIDIRIGDFREVLADLEGALDVIITDPPYPAEFLPLYGIRVPRDEYGNPQSTDMEREGLAEIAARLLKPGGICAVMVGQSYLPEILERMEGAGLTYHWTLAYLTPGGQATQLWQRNVNTFWKPVLIYTKGDYAGGWIGDVTRSDVNDNDKDHHHWGQSESGMADLISRLSKPGQLICDPFLGGGTTALVAHDLGRRFVGCDVDETCLAATKARFGDSER